MVKNKKLLRKYLFIEEKKIIYNTYIWWVELGLDCDWHAAPTSAIISVPYDSAENIRCLCRIAHLMPPIDTAKIISLNITCIKW